MKIEDLRNIGSKLFSEIGSIRLRPFVSESLGRGAGGDKTFPIDKKAEDMIINQLRLLKEPLTIVSEEVGIEKLNGGGKKVLIDPIDGSKNAITGIPFYCTSIAVADGENIGSIYLSYVINLLTGDEFWAEKGKGAFFSGQRINCQADDTIYLVAYEAQDTKRDISKIVRLLGEAWRTRCLGATALDISYVAYGAISIFVTPSPSRAFDFAGGWLLVKEAGGIFTDIKGSSIEETEIGLKKSAPILVSGNHRLHEKALKLLNG
jgi:myo-inositol-1(or 4)-monophosphatase